MEGRQRSTEARVGVKARQKRLSPLQNLLQFLSAAYDCLFHSAVASGWVGGWVGDSFSLSSVRISLTVRTADI